MRAFNTAVKRVCMRKSELIIQTEEKLLFACHHFWFKSQPHMSESFHITLVAFFYLAQWLYWKIKRGNDIHRYDKYILTTQRRDLSREAPCKSLQHLLEELITKADLERLKANHDNRSNVEWQILIKNYLKLCRNVLVPYGARTLRRTLNQVWNI